MPSRSGVVGNKQSKAGKAVGGSYPTTASFRVDTMITRLEHTCGRASTQPASCRSSTSSTPSPASRRAIPTGGSRPAIARCPSLHPGQRPRAGPGDDGHVQPLGGGDAHATVRFVNLGDVDRAGHADDGGNTVTKSSNSANPQADENAKRANEFQKGAMRGTSTFGLFFDKLKSEGWWEESVIILLSDHGMNWANREHWIEHRRGARRRAQQGRGSGGRRPAHGRPVEDLQQLDRLHRRQQWRHRPGRTSSKRTRRSRRRDCGTLRNMPGMQRVFADPDDFSNTGEDPQRHGGPPPLHPRSAYGLEDELGGDAIVIASPGWSFNPDSNPQTNPVPGVHGRCRRNHAEHNDGDGRSPELAARTASRVLTSGRFRTAGRRCRRTEGLASCRSPRRWPRLRGSAKFLGCTTGSS